MTRTRLIRHRLRPTLCSSSSCPRWFAVSLNFLPRPSLLHLLFFFALLLFIQLYSSNLFQHTIPLRTNFFGRAPDGGVPVIQVWTPFLPLVLALARFHPLVPYIYPHSLPSRTFSPRFARIATAHPLPLRVPFASQPAADLHPFLFLSSPAGTTRLRTRRRSDSRRRVSVSYRSSPATRLLTCSSAPRMLPQKTFPSSTLASLASVHTFSLLSDCSAYRSRLGLGTLTTMLVPHLSPIPSSLARLVPVDAILAFFLIAVLPQE